MLNELKHKPLKFGTSGLRGPDSELTDLQIYISTKGFLNFLIKSGINNFSKVALAGDFRPSTPRISIAIATALIENGLEIDYCGKVPTPVVSLYGFTNKIPSIMVTGSHNPYGQNGVKFVKPHSEVLKEDEKEILENIDKVRRQEFNKSDEETLFDDSGYFKDFNEMNSEQRFLFLKARVSVSSARINIESEELYIKRYKDAFGKILAGEKIVFYQQTAVGRELIPRVFEELGAVVIREEKVDETKEFIAVDTEDMKFHLLEKMANLALKNNCFYSVTTDGDSDRPAIVILRKGNDGKPLYKNGKLDYFYIKGDNLNVLSILLYKPHFIAAPINFNYKSSEFLKKNGIEVKFTRVGAPHIVKAMQNRLEKERIKFEKKGIKLEHSELLEKIGLYGFEVNGGAMLGSSKPFPKEIFNGIENSGHGRLTPLPTRDSTFPILCALILAKKIGIPLEELFFKIFSGEYESYSHAGLIENLTGLVITPGCERYTPEVGKKLLAHFSPKNKDAVEIHFEKEVRFVDEDGNEILVKEELIEHAIKINNTLLFYFDEFFEEKVKIKKINYLDGIRIYLTNEEIIHLRPSGNANQFRIYVETDNFERALKMIERAIRGNDGLLVKLINDIIDEKVKM
ncbi:MAG: hypothetical protein WC867_08465 [Candidatus Pacearchaeota archaeon]|jgi:phosphomannomutase